MDMQSSGILKSVTCFGERLGQLDHEHGNVYFSFEGDDNIEFFFKQSDLAWTVFSSMIASAIGRNVELTATGEADGIGGAGANRHHLIKLDWSNA